MACSQCLVHPDPSGGWSVHFASRDAGPYASRDLALRVAAIEAFQVFATGQSVCLAIEDSKGELCAARCLCVRFQDYLSHKQ